MSYAEVVSELVYHLHVPLNIIAGLTDVQIKDVYARARDKYGKLKRGGGNEDGKGIPRVPPGQRAAFDVMYRRRLLAAGYTEEKVEERWAAFVHNNPSVLRVVQWRPRQKVVPSPGQGLGPPVVRRRRLRRGLN